MDHRFLSRFLYLQVLILAGFLTCLVYGGFVISLFDSDLTGGDRTAGWHAHCAMQAYTDEGHIGALGDPPHNAMPYVPLSYLANGAMGVLFGGGFEATLFGGRLLSLLMTVLSSVLIFLITKNLGTSNAGSLFAAFLFPIGGNIQVFAVALRPDALVCALTLAGLLCALRYRAYVFAGAFFGLALTAKQSFIVGPLAIAWTLWRLHDFKGIIQLAIGGIATVATVVMLAYTRLGSHWMDGILLQNFTYFSVKRAIEYVGETFKMSSSIPIALGLASNLLPNLPKGVRFFSIYLIFCFFLHSIALAKFGAWVNYMLEPLAIGSILTGWLFGHFATEASSTARSFVYATLAIVFTGLVMHEGVATRLAYKQPRYEPFATVVNFLRNIDGPILTDESDLYFVTGKTPWFQPFDLIQQGIRLKKLPANAVESRISSHFFDAVVIRKNNDSYWDPHWTSLIRAHYNYYDTIDGLAVYLPSTPST